MRATHSHDIEFRNCRIGFDALLGDEATAPRVLEFEGPPFIGVAAVSLGIAIAALRFAVDYCRKAGKGQVPAVRRVSERSRWRPRLRHSFCAGQPVRRRQGT